MGLCEVREKRWVCADVKLEKRDEFVLEKRDDFVLV